MGYIPIIYFLIGLFPQGVYTNKLKKNPKMPQKLEKLI